MRASLRLALALLRERPRRLALTSLAVVASTCIVVWIVSGYEAVLRSHDVYSDRALGRYVLSVDPISRAPDRNVPPAIVDTLREDPSVTTADPMWAEKIMARSDRTVVGPFSPEVLVLGTDAPRPPFDLERGKWLDATGETEAIPVCLSTEVAERMGLELGSTFTVGRGDRGHELEVVGLVANPPRPVTGRYVGSMNLPSPSIAGAYVRMADAERIHGRPRRITFVGVTLADGVDVHGFRYAWGPRLAEGANPQQFQEDHDLEEELDEAAAASNVALQSHAATAIGLLLAFLVVFNTLNMGVTERMRQLALLRAVALTRRQVATVILIEGLVIAGIGFLGGMLLSGVVVGLTGSLSGDVLRHGASIGGMSLGLAAVVSFGAAGLASLVPAWRATRVRPLDAIAPRRAHVGGPGRSLPWLTIAALLLITINPLLSFVTPPDFEGPVVPTLLVGFAALAAGTLLIAPAVVVLAERAIGPLLSRLLRLSPGLLAQQLSAHPWRSVGAATALSIGLGLFVAIQTWGFTMLETFVPGRWAPDVMVSFGDRPVTDRELAAVTRISGVDGERCEPLVVEQPRLLRDLTGSAERASIIRQDNVIMVGIDPPGAFGGDRPLLDCDWTHGSPEDAVARMQRGHACVVPDHFLRESGLAVGDRFTVVPPEDANRPCEYEIAGAVRLSGWHWQTKSTGLRVRTHRAAALIFADYASVAADFELTAPSHVWFRYDPAIADPAAVAEELRAIRPDAPVGRTHDGYPTGDPAAIQVVPVERVRATVRGMAARWIWAMSVLPLVAMLVACIGLLNLVLASLRARRREFGILRAIGFTRGTLVRLIVAENLLVGVTALVLGVVFGVVAGWCGTGAASVMSFFGGMRPVLTIPTMAILASGLLLLAFTALTALGPAVGIGRTRPLELLRKGAVTF